MSLIRSKAIQMGYDATPSNNFLIYQPLTPDGTFRIANGNQGATTDIMTVSSTGNVTFAGSTNFASLNFGSGSVTAPSLYPTGDSNTGLFFPAADTVGITTGGTERVRIDSNGLTLAGGTANGVAYLNGSKVLTTGSALTFDGTGLLVGTSTTNGYKLGVVTASAASSTQNGLNVSDYTTTDFNVKLTNGVALLSVGNGQSLAFGYNNTTEGMRLTSTGLGIGTSSPSGKLDVTGNLGTVRVTTNGAQLDFTRNNASYIRATDAAGYLIFATGGAVDRMTLDSSGNLGLGVTPSAWANTKAIDISSYGGLSVDTAYDGNYSMSSNAYATAYNAWKYKVSGLYAAKYTQSILNGQHTWYTAPSGTAGNAISFTQAMTLDASGNLLIGRFEHDGFPARINSLVQSGDHVLRMTRAGVVATTIKALGSSAAMTFGVDVIAGDTERMRIDSIGNVGIGTSSPGYRLHINTDGSLSNIALTSTGGVVGATDYKLMQGITGVSNAGFSIRDITNNVDRIVINGIGNVGIGTSSPAGVLTLGGSGALQQYFITSSATAQDNAIVSLYNNGTQYSQLVHDAAYYTWKTAGTERMRIDSSGNLLVGTSSVPSTSVNGFSVTNSGNSIQIASATQTLSTWQHNNYTSGNRYSSAFYVGASLVGYISHTSTTTTYSTSSDYRLKENIQPMQNALATVAQLNPVTYTWKADGSDGQGFIAHELQAVVPDCVTGEKDAVDEEGNPVYQGVDTSFLVATLTKAIQEQQEIIESLKARLDAAGL